MAIVGPVQANEEPMGALNRLKEAHLGAQPTVRVLVVRDAPTALLEVHGKFRVYDPASGEYLSGGRDKKFMVRGLEDGIQWGEEFPGRYQFEVVPRSLSTSIFINGIQYQGAVACYFVEGKLFVVNEVKVEEFLHALLPSYLEGGPRGEALAAAAIVARTDLLAQTSARPAAIWHLDAKKVGYLGYATAYSDPELEKVLEQTAGLVLVAGEAGHPFRVCWGELPSAPLPAANLFDHGRTDLVAGTPKNRPQWTCTLPKAELAKLAGIQAVRQVASRADPTSGRICALTVSDGKSSHEISLNSLQEKLGQRRLRSPQFQVSLIGENVRFLGHSEGNGLDLIAAQEMAERGRDATSILKSFFPEAQLRPWGE